MNNSLRRHLSRGLLIPALCLAATASARADWWNTEWSARAPLTLETTAPADAAPILVRLHSGNFDFSSVKEDGSDLRFVAADGKTLLPHRIERFDTLVGEAFVWVKAPAAAKPGEPVKFSVYYGNAAAPAAEDKGLYDTATALVWHFGEKGAPAHDWSGRAADAETVATGVEGALIGAGVRFDGTKPLTIPATPALELADKAASTVSLWFNNTAGKDTGVIYSRRDGANALVAGLRKGIPYVDITRAGTTTRADAASVAPAGKWHHLAVVTSAEGVSLHLDGVKVAANTAAAPALKSKATLAGDTVAGAVGFAGEIDELSIATAARSAEAIAFAAKNEGTDGATSVTVGAAEAGEGASAGGGEEHAGYFKVILDSLTLDGWIVIGILGVMAAASWVLMITKVGYLNTGAKGNKVFMRGWSKLSRNLHAIDGGDHSKVESLGDNLTPGEQRVVKKSPIYRIFAVGAEEIRTRMTAEGSTKVLTAESIEAVRARLDGAMVRETQKLDKLMVILTISISGGPFLGLLGTVVGVMITFAAVAMAGEVNVNAIAPGISAALLATVAGLAVAIPALFGYNYILGRIKDIKADVQVFIDEFITSMAEFYQPGAETHPESDDKVSRETVDALLEKIARLLHERGRKTNASVIATRDDGVPAGL